MKEPKPSNKPKQTRSILSKVFGKKRSPNHKKQLLPKHLPNRDHVSQCDENGNSKSRLTNEDKSSKESGKTKKNNRKGRIKLFIFGRKKDESVTEIPGTPIYVELSPAKSLVPDLISDDIYRHSKRSNMTDDSNPSQSSSENGRKKENSPTHGQSIGLLKDSQTGDAHSEENSYDTIPLEQKQVNNQVKPMTADLGRQHAKRARSFNSKDLHGSVPFRNETAQPDAAENDVPASVYAGMCRKSNRMLQTVQESGSKRRVDRSFLRWNSVSDLQYQTSKDKNKAISKMSKVSQNDKSISLQDLSTKHNKTTESANHPTMNPSSPAHGQVTPQSQPVKISKIRPSFDKALSKSEYDLRNFHTSPRSRGILAFKKVNLANVRRSGTRPVSAIVPSTLSIIGENLHRRDEIGPIGAVENTISKCNRARAVVEPMCHSPARIEAEYVDINCIQSSLPDYGISTANAGRDTRINGNGNVNLSRTHSFQDRYSPPLYRRAHRNDVARPMSCIEQDLTRYPPLLKANERNLSENTSRRGGTVSRSRSRARSIAKRFNIASSTENIAPPKLAVCRSSNWKSDLDANTEYCAMKPLLRDSSTLKFEERSMGAGYSDIPFHYNGVTERNRLAYRYGNISGPYYSDQIVLDGPYPEPLHPNIRRKLFYALDV